MDSQAKFYREHIAPHYWQTGTRQWHPSACRERILIVRNLVRPDYTSRVAAARGGMLPSPAHQVRSSNWTWDMFHHSPGRNCSKPTSLYRLTNHQASRIIPSSDPDYYGSPGP
ncbi:hypothetical protein PGT21_020655 [Puccinia graminis f. sp. tritici]|uniref:Uncharacterized protein n=1 Tax=Puccinia graminis f. sp. tritici TaxID=56615 RepID=A0A5B0QHB4_PUCGR|nr:hypothetical protein PGT21_020655 [Puccinia graminis f. sp. tritici]KAA1112334.1 hypothetical protein PGTUg99_016776 [Puccinia graminis f. sp. tritici]